MSNGPFPTAFLSAATTVASTSSRMSSPSGVGSTTVRCSRSVSMRLWIARSISAAPAMTTPNTDCGSCTKSPLASSCRNSTISSTKLNIARVLADRGERRAGVGGDRKDRIETADGEHLSDIGVEAEQRQFAVLLLHLLRHHQQ